MNPTKSTFVAIVVVHPHPLPGKNPPNITKSNKIQTPKFKIQNPKSKLQNANPKIQDPESKIKTPKCKPQNPRSRLQNQNSKIQTPKSKIQNPKSKLQNPNCRIKPPKSPPKKMKGPLENLFSLIYFIWFTFFSFVFIFVFVFLFSSFHYLCFLCFFLCHSLDFPSRPKTPKQKLGGPSPWGKAGLAPCRQCTCSSFLAGFMDPRFQPRICGQLGGNACFPDLFACQCGIDQHGAVATTTHVGSAPGPPHKSANKQI